MNLFQIQKRFNTKNKCIKHLEKVRWNNEPVCPHCKKSSVTKRKARKFYYHCNKCNKDFTVLMGTIFEASKMPLPKWFMLVGLMLNARKGVSAMQLHRNLGITYKSAWYSAMRVRCAMIDQIDMLEGIIEMDEAYFGGKPRHRTGMGVTPENQASISEVTLKRGRGTKKVPVVGIVEREGKKRVALEVYGDRMTSKNMLALLKEYVNTEKAIAMTDEASFYKIFEKELQHLIVTHSKGEYARGIVHTNTIEGVWSLIKNGIKGEYHALSRKYLPFYLAEFAYKYNRRSKEDKATAFNETVVKSVSDQKCLVEYKPKGDVQQIAYGKKTGKKSSKKSIRKHKKLKSKPRKNIKRRFKPVKVKSKKQQKGKQIPVKRKVQIKKKVKNRPVKKAIKK